MRGRNIEYLQEIPFLAQKMISCEIEDFSTPYKMKMGVIFEEYKMKP